MIFRGITMPQFWTLFGALAGVLLLVYLLRFGRRGRTISSNLLWRRVVKTKRSIWSEVISFLLHLLIIALVTFALTDPAPAENKVHRRYVAVVVDASISMGVRVSADKTRLDMAADEAWKMIESLNPVDRFLVVSAGEEVRALTAFTGHPEEAKAALESIKPLGRAPKIEDAIEYVRNAVSFLSLRPGDSVHLYLFTDRPDQTVLPNMDGIDGKVVGVGTPVENTGITAFDVRKPFNLTSGHELMVTAANYGQGHSTCELIVYTPKSTVGKEKLTLAPGQELTRYYFLPFGVQGKVTALLQDITYKNAEDELPTDDAAFAFIPPQKKINVLLVTKGNMFLRQALKLNPQVALHEIAPSQYSPGSSGGYTVVIFEDFTPPKPPFTNAIYIHPAQGGPFSIAKKVENPAMTGWNDGHPMLRYITLQDLTIEEASPIRPKKTDTVLAGYYEDALMVLRDVGPHKIMGVAFSLKKSDLPLRIAFPILFHNAIAFFAESEDAEQRTGFRMGEKVTLPVADSSETFTVRTPYDQTMTLYPSGGTVTFFPHRPGFYGYDRGDTERFVAVSLVDPEESDLSTARSDPVPPFESRQGETRRETFWYYFIMLAFALVVLDFWLYNNGKLP